MSLKITLEQIEFNTGVADINGCLWYVQTFDGWDSAPQRSQLLDFTAKDGQARGRADYSSRALSLEGLCKAPNEDAFWGSYNLLLAITGQLNTPMDLTVTEGTVEKTMKVYRASEVKNAIHPGWFEFSIPVYAPDPAKYGVEDSVTIPVGGSVVIENTGTYASEGLVFTTRAAGAVKLTHDESKRSIISKSVDEGTIFNVRDRTVYSGTINRYGELSTQSLWWSLAPGNNRVRNDGAASVTVQYRPAWV